MRLLFFVMSSCMCLYLSGQCSVGGQTFMDNGSGQVNVNNMGAPSNIVTGAMGQWNNCNGTAPTLSTSSPNGQSVNIVLLNQNANPGTLAHTLVSTNPTITLYTHDEFGHEFTPAELTYILAHEMGHALGLNDILGSPSCLMGEAVRQADGSYTAKAVTGTDCQSVANLWTAPEPDPPQDEPCRPKLKWQGPGRVGSHGDCSSPIVIDLEQDGFHFGGPENPVTFDMSGNGVAKTLHWVAPYAHDAFLVQDLNGNGLVDDGAELFGTGTRLLLENFSLASDGFQGLSQYDRVELGGDDDQWITPNDQIWSRLYLWLDENADGICEYDEMLPLTQVPFSRLDLNPARRGLIDDHGNGLWLWGWAYQDDLAFPENRFRMVDVFLRIIAEDDPSGPR